MFAKYGKVTKLDFLFHKSGELKGKPRGYAFVEYASQNEAQKALTSANGVMFRGRNLVVTHAHQAPPDTDGGIARQRKTMMETGRPTTLSLLKSNPGGKHQEGTSDKIAMMEAKLRELEASKPKNDSEPGTSTLPTSSLPTHPSLPSKPLSGIPGVPVQRPRHSSVRSASSTTASPASASTSRPLTVSSEPPMKKMKFAPASADVAKRKNGSKVLSGVKIVKKRASPSASIPKPDPAVIESPVSVNADQDLHEALV
ncbi:hypothetical protein GYMLUDRAFT_40122 [Collybiopsis luxurians FD-317 M1]|uniref:RRM domain-containing protein n=1 Tax=Collybiopsis luxurians FD-317 M1 TaxID=944289 RepID=A0A0D0CW02_9AGAR|nr:hypothetical protein GYMLUDRAFT_40122 [Collybiopsis luxurians FD-317 M1]